MSANLRNFTRSVFVFDAVVQRVALMIGTSNLRAKGGPQETYFGTIVGFLPL